MLGLQDGVSPLMEQLVFFHDHVMTMIVLILTLVGYVMVSVLMNSMTNRTLFEHQVIEVIWTIVPAVILVFVAVPSLRLLYLLDETNNPSVTLKAIGHQWYWSYQYSDFKSIEFDSYMVPSQDHTVEGFRLLDVDNRAVVPMLTQIRAVVSAADVIHAWAVPGLGVKVDAVPGRLNQVSFMVSRPGVYFGQCSEICGANHSFMPIVIESVPASNFINWVTSS